jgi:hypothetical protein
MYYVIEYQIRGNWGIVRDSSSDPALFRCVKWIKLSPPNDTGWRPSPIPPNYCWLKNSSSNVILFKSKSMEECIEFAAVESLCGS